MTPAESFALIRFVTSHEEWLHVQQRLQAHVALGQHAQSLATSVAVTAFVDLALRPHETQGPYYLEALEALARSFVAGCVSYCLHTLHEGESRRVIRATERTSTESSDRTDHTISSVTSRVRDQPVRRPSRRRNAHILAS